MPVMLSAELKQELSRQDGTVRLTDPDTGAEYVVLPAAEYDAVREAVEEEKFLRALAKRSAEVMGRRLKDEPWPQ